MYSLPEISYVWTSNDSSSYDANTKIFFNSTKEELYAVNMCNEIIHVKVVEYRIQIHNLTFQNLNFTLILHINNTVGSTNCSHIFLRNRKYLGLFITYFRSFKVQAMLSCNIPKSDDHCFSSKHAAFHRIVTISKVQDRTELLFSLL